MHNASTKQRLSALRRRLGIFTGWQPRWVKERTKRLARLAEQAGAIRAASLATAAPGNDAPTELVSADQDGWAGPQLSAITPSPSTAEEPLDPLPCSEGERDVARDQERRPRVPVVAIAVLGLLVSLAAIVFRAVRVPDASRQDPAPEPVPAAVADGSRSPAAPEPAGAAPSASPSAEALGDQEAHPQGVPIVVVRRGDSLWHLSAVHLGDPMRWPKLHAANAGQIANPDRIFPGQRLSVPGDSAN